MKKSPLSNFMKKDWKIVEQWKWYVGVSIAIILVGIILACTIGPKIGIEFQSGYVITVEYNDASLTTENRGATADKITDILESMEYEDDGVKTSYGIKVSNVRYQGSKNDMSIRLIYRSDYLFTLQAEAFDEAQTDIKTQLQDALADENNPFIVNVEAAGQVSPTISTELLLTALAAIIAASAVMLLYVMFRFELASGLSAIIALIHDIAIMFAFMVFCRVEITSTFIAALVAILGYSINNTLVVFDRLRENQKLSLYKNNSINEIVNISLKETFTRSVNTTVTTLFAMIMLAILGVESIRIFAFPIIIGLISGAYSSFCLAPSLFCLMKKGSKDAKKKKAKARLAAKSAARSAR